ncbi:MAG TPA: hypothetical protein VD884_20100, partial [Ohtaekwangia sp.]|nr:hypothetical protein [Ohtaekwangia sp.]
DGMEMRRDPFNWFLTGNVNIKLFGYDAPLSFSYSNANRSFSQPFNQFSFQPHYKWIKTYIGYNSMTFSNYTLAGHVFLGGGVDLSPGKWKISAMAGRLRKAVPFDVNDSLQHFNASYKRMGYGLKLGYEDNGDRIAFSIFTARDEKNSIPFVYPESDLTPMQNVAISIAGRKTFLKRFFVDAEYAISAINKDTRLNESGDTLETKSNNLLHGILPENSTSRYYDALNASLGYQGNWFSVQVKYERIAPEYQTLGAYFFNNDLRNITVAPSVRLFDNTLNLTANVGIQQNNLDDTRASTTERKVGSISANYAPNERWNFVMDYSNFTSYTNIKPQPDPFFQNPLDTLNFFQVSQTLNHTIIRSLGSQEKPQNIMLNASYQKVSDKASYEGGDHGSDFFSINVSYNYSVVPKNLTLSVAGNWYENNAGGLRSTYWGPTLGLTKAFYEKTLRTSLATSYNETSGDVSSSPVLNNRLSLTFSPKSKKKSGNTPHNFSAGVNLLKRMKSLENAPAYTETTATVNYSYSF